MTCLSRQDERILFETNMQSNRFQLNVMGNVMSRITVMPPKQKEINGVASFICCRREFLMANK